MDSGKLLIIGQSPECAEEINSLLRNSGISIRMSFVSSVSETEESVQSSSPLLIIYDASASETIPVTKILHLAEIYQVDVALRVAPSELSILQDALGTHGCFAISNENGEQLLNLVKTLLERDVTKHQDQDVNRRLDELQTRYKLLLDHSREPVAYIHEGLHVYANRAYLKLLQHKDFNEIETVSILEIMHGEDLDLKKLLRDMNNGSYPDGFIKVDIDTPSGSVIDAELAFSASRFDGEDCIQMMVQKVDANAVLIEELDRLRRVDPVTELTNKKTFLELLDQAIEEAGSSGTYQAVYYLEADDSEHLAIQAGSAGWDRILIEISKAIQSSINENETAARFSDNGFAILASRDEKGQLQELGEQLVSALSNQALQLETESVSVTCSVGMANIGALARDADEIIVRVQSAFALASSGGNCLKKFKPQSDATEPGEQDEQWTERIRFALDNQDLYSVQQSIVNLEGESEGLFENRTFLRSDGGDLTAAQFMPVAERHDLGATIDRQVIKGLMSSLSGTGDRHIINLSVNSLLDFSFPNWFRHELKESGVQGSQIILQLEATAVESCLKPAAKLILELKSSGCGFSLSNFDDQRRISALLHQIDVLMVKIRSGLTDGLSNNSAHQGIIRNIVKAVESVGADVIADDIADAADLAILWQCGVKLVAGDFLKDASKVGSTS